MSTSTLHDLKELVQNRAAENMRLEFKSSKLFYQNKNNQPDKKTYINKITKAISGFANVEGGKIIIGIETTKVKNEPDTANKLDMGIAFSDFSPEIIQQTLEAHLSPPLLGIRFIPVKTFENSKHYFLIIRVPKGSTAHQASDKKYYGRSEYETNALDDNVIRLLMTRESSPSAIIEIENLKIKSTRKTQYGNNELDISFEVVLHNIGDITITEFKSWFRLFRPPIGKVITGLELLKPSGASYIYRDGWKPPEGTSYAINMYNMVKNTTDLLSLRIYPDDKFTIEHYNFSLVHYHDLEIDDKLIKEEKQSFIDDLTKALADDVELLEKTLGTQLELFEARLSSFKLEWKLYLPNTQPIIGTAYGVREAVIDEIKKQLKNINKKDGA